MIVINNILETGKSNLLITDLEVDSGCIHIHAVLQVEWRYTEEGEKVRVSTRTGRILPIPKLAEETPDYKTKATYAEQEKDTPSDEVTRYAVIFGGDGGGWSVEAGAVA